MWLFRYVSGRRCTVLIRYAFRLLLRYVKYYLYSVRYVILFGCMWNCVFMFVYVFTFTYSVTTFSSKRKIVRMKIQSSQDLENFAVNVAILEKVSLTLHKRPLKLYIPVLMTAGRTRVLIMFS